MDKQDIPVASVKDDEIVVGKNDKKCAPSFTFEDRSCIPVELLVEMAKGWNKEFPNKEIFIHSNVDKVVMLNPTKYKRYLLKEFSDKLADKCDNQQCWVDQDYINRLSAASQERLKNGIVRPEGPADSLKWLNTININDVMAQYETKYKDFKYLGTHPVDFANFKELEINNLDFERLKQQGKTKLGVVFNSDESTGSGKHWTAAFIDIEKGNVYYFDSVGAGPEQRVRSFLRQCDRKCKQKGEVTFNKVKHQRQNTECGVYSINFILRMLKGETFEEITTNVTSDAKMSRCRKVYFN